jgi:hypothetical protein
MRVTLEPGDRDILLDRLGLAASATDSELVEAGVARMLASTPRPGRREAVRSGGELVARHFTDRSTPDGHDLIAAAVADERIPRSRADHWAQRYAEDPEGTAKTLARITDAATVEKRVAAAQRPPPATGPPSGDSSYPPHWLPEIHGGRRERVMGGD